MGSFQTHRRPRVIPTPTAAPPRKAVTSASPPAPTTKLTHDTSSPVALALAAVHGPQRPSRA